MFEYIPLPYCPLVPWTSQKVEFRIFFYFEERRKKTIVNFFGLQPLGYNHPAIITVKITTKSEFFASSKWKIRSLRYRRIFFLVIVKEKSHDYLGVYPLRSLCTELQKLEKYRNTNILKLFLTVASHEKLKSANKKEGKKTPKTGDKDHNSIRK